MQDDLIRIKRLVIQGDYIFTDKALDEMYSDSLSKVDVIESILNAQFIRSKNSKSEHKENKKEKTYIIESYSLTGLLIYSKGVIKGPKNNQKYYLLVSSKKSTHDEYESRI
jgi:hypothetical protein